MHKIPCYGLDEVTGETPPPRRVSYGKFSSNFNVEPRQLKKLTSIDLVISMRQNVFHPKPVKTIVNVVLNKGLLLYM